MRGLVVGRFQPFHKGHEALIREAIEDCVHVAVAIGSAEARQDTRNPFTYEEREQMVKAVFGPAVEVYGVKDIRDPDRWAEHVTGITGPVDKVYGNHDRDLLLFEHAGYDVVQPGLVDRERFEATHVRAQIAEDDRAWRQAIPKQVVALLDAWDAGRRLRLIEARA